MPGQLVAPPEGWVALSIKQPWAALIVAGLKSIEVRTWPTRRQGPVLIHASKIPDDRPEGWALVQTPEVQALTELRGGILGLASLVDCREYADAQAFAQDQLLHRNALAWFRPPRLFGHVFEEARPLPFCPYPGQTLYFSVPNYDAAGSRNRKPRNDPPRSGD